MLDTALIRADKHFVDATSDPIASPPLLAGNEGYSADRIDEYFVSLGINRLISSRWNEDRDDRSVEFELQAY